MTLIENQKRFHILVLSQKIGLFTKLNKTQNDTPNLLEYILPEFVETEAVPSKLVDQSS